MITDLETLLREAFKAGYARGTEHDPEDDVELAADAAWHETREGLVPEAFVVTEG